MTSVLDRIPAMVETWKSDLRRPTAWDMAPSLLYFVLHVVVSLLITRPILTRVGKAILIYNRGETYYKENKSRILKFADEGFSFLCHIVVLYLGWILFREERWWFYNTPILGSMFPPHVKYSFGLRQFYCIVTGYYSYVSLYVLYQKFVQKFCPDFTEMFFHHSLSLVLLLYSYYSGYASYGCILLHIHNLTDMFSYPLRLGNYVKAFSLSVAFLPICMLAWIILRLWAFPRYIIGASVVAIHYPDFDGYGTGHSIHGVILMVLMAVLYGLHAYWVYAMFYIAWELTSGQSKKWRD